MPRAAVAAPALVVASGKDHARWREALAGQRPVIGLWVVSGSPVVAEICAGSAWTGG